jgi:hypothetical protein
MRYFTIVIVVAWMLSPAWAYGSSPARLNAVARRRCWGHWVLDGTSSTRTSPPTRFEVRAQTFVAHTRHCLAGLLTERRSKRGHFRLDESGDLVVKFTRETRCIESVSPTH